MGKLVFGVNNSWAMKRFTQPESWIELAATRLEVDFVQFSLDLLDPQNNDAVDEIVAETKDCCRRYGIKIESSFTGLAAYSSNLLLHPSSRLREDAFEWYSRAIALSAKLGAEATGGYMGAFTLKDFNDERRRELLLAELARRVVELSRIGKEHGLKTLLWESMPIPREPPSTIVEARKMLDRVNLSSMLPVRLCIDVGHCDPNAANVRDRDPYVWLSELGSVSPYVHLQQTDGNADRHWPFTEKYNRIGIIDGRKVISALEKSAASKTYLYLEVFPPFEQEDGQVVDDVVESVKYWKTYMS